MVYHALDVEGVISCWPAGHGTATAPDDRPGALSGTVVIAETNPDHRDRREHRASSPRRRPDPAETSSPSTTEPHPHVVTLNARQHRGRRGRPNAHHNPLQPFRPEGRIRYNPKLPKAKPRAMPDERWRDLFAGLRSNRDRALLAIAISNGARASELLGMRNI